MARIKHVLHERSLVHKQLLEFRKLHLVDENGRLKDPSLAPLPRSLRQARAKRDESAAAAAAAAAAAEAAPTTTTTAEAN